jgi:hypothetical protein
MILVKFLISQNIFPLLLADSLYIYISFHIPSAFWYVMLRSQQNAAATGACCPRLSVAENLQHAEKDALTKMRELLQLGELQWLWVAVEVINGF